MSTWLRYLAVITLVGNGFTVFWNVIALGRKLRTEALVASQAGLIAFNLTFSITAIALAALVATPTRRDIGLTTKIIAIPSVLGGAIGVVSAATSIYARMGELDTGPSTDGLMVAINELIMMQSVEGAFFSACTLALAILVIASRRSSV